MSSHAEISYKAIPKSTVALSTESTRSTSGQPVRWQVAARTPITMLALFLSGVAVSVGHHAFYSRLNGSAVRSAEDGSKYLTQIWIIRYGTAFAFLAKALLASAVVVAYKQQIWINLRARANSISTIDAMFAATYDVLAAVSPRLLLRAKLPALMALITWLLPLAALITPSTLIVVPSSRDNVTMMHVPTLNFNDSGQYAAAGVTDGTSPLITRLTTAMASSMEVLPMRAIAPNTTYRHEFLGPSLSCENLVGDGLDNLTAIWDLTENAMKGPAGGVLLYLAYSRTSGSLANDTTTDFVSGCVMADTFFGGCSVWGNTAITARVGNESIACTVRQTHFDLTFHAVGDIQTISDVQFEWRDGFKSSTLGLNYNYATQALATLINGAIGIGVFNSTVPGANWTSSTALVRTVRTRIMNTALIGKLSTAFIGPEGVSMSDLPQADRDLAANRTLAVMIEELSRNQTLSLFSDQRFWLPQSTTNTTLVTQSSFYTKYEYHPRNLVMTYSIAIAFSAFGVVLGLWALWVNGISHETSFSSIMTTTRNKYLDEMTLGYSLGSAPTPDAVKKLELRFGELRDGGIEDKSRAAFGLEGETAPLRKGQIIY